MSEKKTSKKSAAQKYDFSVSLMPLKTSNGIIVPNRAVYRSDIKKVIGVVGREYKLIKHSEVLKQIEESLPVITTTRQINLCQKGAYLFANYESNRIEPVEPRKGDIVKFRIQVFNSYNGRIPVGMRLYALRLACENGMTVPQSISSLHVRHLPGANIIEAREAFIKKLEQFKKQSMVWAKWATLKTSKLKMDEFLTKNLGKGARIMIENKYNDSKDDSVWGLFNAITWFGTHVVQVRGQNVDKPTDRDTSKIIDLAEKQFAFDRNVVEKFYKYNWN